MHFYYKIICSILFTLVAIAAQANIININYLNSCTNTTIASIVYSSNASYITANSYAYNGTTYTLLDSVTIYNATSGNNYYIPSITIGNNTTDSIVIVEANGIVKDTVWQTYNSNLCGSISGTVILDANNNCNTDSTETGIQNIKITIQPTGQAALTNKNGGYIFTNLPVGTYTITINNNTPSYNTSCMASVVVQIDSNNYAPIVTFYDTATTYNDYSIKSIGGNMQVGNNSAQFFINKLNSTTTDTLSCFIKMDSINYFTNAVPAPNVISNDTLFYTFNNINTNQLITVNYMASNTNPIGTAVQFISGITAYTGIDNFSFNNIDTSIYATFLPNNTCNKNSNKQGKLSKYYLYIADTNNFAYQINFANNTSYLASNIVITDSIDSHLNIDSIYIIGSSHNFNINISNNLITFTSNKILLPSNSVDSINSKGYIIYTITTKSNITPYDSIKNFANIYLDNYYIKTNTAYNIFYTAVDTTTKIIVKNTSCNLPCGNGQVVFTNIGGVPPRQYIPSANTCSSFTYNKDSVQNLKTGFTTFTLVDGLNNNYTFTYYINGPDTIIPNLVYTNPVGTTAGSASVTPTGGTPPYDYLWLPINTTSNTIQNLDAGNYSVNIIDKLGCSTGTTFTLSYPSNLFINNKKWFSVFPNPCNSYFTIQSHQPYNAIQLINNVGQTVLQQQLPFLPSRIINTASLPKGYYNLILDSKHSFLIYKSN